ncbi:2OG-Fe(II) oxygenase [Nodularia spumigena CS-586/05]|uniref:2OG-Fe(II) oxygenase n=1 Tax=Nodularia spumigena TaxID=70799 RepID=UPI00232F62A4|nr:2OG-Fe(II) oxygenase [Nodularia spumigena]MDB9342463.1 2OG-Fe(II) oxygenase [Nodularia spumigena CS-588/06]MDB9369193.1 2OG-Fe(II) oxygenase [Nodularia spumigena CS-586/05]
MYIFLQKTRNKILKKIDSIPLIKYQNDVAYQTAVKSHIINLPIMTKADQELVEKIKYEGVVITSLEELGIPSTPDILKAAINLKQKLRPNISGQKNGFVVHASYQQIMEYPEIFYWGLEERLLNIVENYLGLPVAYNGLYFRRDIANNIEQGSRLWHIDREDRKILKIIIYLNDINENTGPLQYIPQNLTLEIVKALKYTSGYIQDSKIREFISPENYKSCTGSIGTVIFAATGSIFHRGKLPINSDRFAIFFDYSSRRQKKRYYIANSQAHEDLFILSQNLPEYKKQCLIY